MLALVPAGPAHTHPTLPHTAPALQGDGSNPLMLGGDLYSPVPVPVAGGLRFSALSCGSLHTCALHVNGSAYCW